MDQFRTNIKNYFLPSAIQVSPFVLSLHLILFLYKGLDPKCSVHEWEQLPLPISILGEWTGCCFERLSVLWEQIFRQCDSLQFKSEL